VCATCHSSSCRREGHEWLCSLYTQENALEWSNFNNQEVREYLSGTKPSSSYMFGPLIDAKEDTVLTSLESIGVPQVVVDWHGTYAYTNLSICRCITLNDVDRFKNVILKPGIVNTVQSFCGCVEPQKVSNCDQLQRPLTNLDVWRSDNNITLDASKCKVLFITSSTAGTVAQTACLLKRTCPSLTDITAGRTLYLSIVK
jgi:hypothetical protein